MKVITKIQRHPAKWITSFTMIVVLCYLPVLSFAQNITFSSSNPAVAPANIVVPSTKQPIYRTVITFSNGTGNNLDKVTFTPTGTFDIDDISDYVVWWNTVDNLATASSHQNADATTYGGSGDLVSIDINRPSFNNGTTYYFWITVNVSPIANTDDGHTITVSALTPSNFEFTKTATKTGTMYVGGTQTLIASGPNIILSPKTLMGFSYIVSYGPSSYQSYTVRGTGLTGNVNITAPAHYEISTSSGSGYSNSLLLLQSGGVLLSTTIYVRLKAGLSINTYNSENIVHTSVNATTKNVSCSGTVTCDLDPPTVISPITYCQNATASPLTANGTNLLWVQTGSSSVGGTTDPKKDVNSDNTWNNKTTNFTVNANVSTVTINSVNWFVLKWQVVTGVRVAIQNADGTPITNGTQTNPAITLNQVSYDRKQISTFSDLVLTPGNYRIGLATGSGQFGYINPGYPQTEPTGSINITGNNGGQLYYNLQFSYTTQSSTAPTPNTSTVGSTYYYVTQTVNGCTSGPATIEVIVVSGGANMTVTPASSSPTLCINTALTSITHTTTGATGISNDGVSGANGLPAGVSAHWASNTITINGTPSETGTFNYSIPLTGGCGSVSATGTITVLPEVETPTASSNSPICAGATLNLTASTISGATYSWTGPNGFTSSVQNPSITNATTAATGTYSVTATVSGCTSTAGTTSVTVYAPPTTATINTTPLNYCGTLVSDPLGGNTPTIGTGEWSIVSGPGVATGTFSAGTSGSSTFTGTSGYGTYVLRWTISNGTCTPSTADVTVTYADQPISGTLIPSPATGTICSGVPVSASATTGTGGSGTITDVLQYRFDGGTWNTYSSGQTLNTTGHSSVNIQTYRTATGTGCNTSAPNQVSWIINSPRVTLSSDYIEDCPELIPEQGFNPQSGSYDAGSTKLVFEVALSGTTSAIWSFDYAIGGTGVSVRTSGVPALPLYYPQNGSISNTTSNPVVLTFYINNNPPVELHPSLTISNITDANGCPASVVSSSVTIKAMPDVGDYE